METVVGGISAWGMNTLGHGVSLVGGWRMLGKFFYLVCGR